jgi:hypothetical protein
MAAGGLARLVPLPAGAAWVRIPATSTPRLTIGVASALLCAAEREEMNIFAFLFISFSQNNRGKSEISSV